MNREAVLAIDLSEDGSIGSHHFFIRAKGNLLSILKRTAQSVGSEVVNSAANIAKYFIQGKHAKATSEEHINKSIDKLTDRQSGSGINKSLKRKVFSQFKKKEFWIFSIKKWTRKQVHATSRRLIFSASPIQTFIEEGSWIKVNPLSGFETGTVEFEIVDTDEYVDLKISRPNFELKFH